LVIHSWAVILHTMIAFSQVHTYPEIIKNHHEIIEEIANFCFFAKFFNAVLSRCSFLVAYNTFFQSIYFNVKLNTSNFLCSILYVKMSILTELMFLFLT